MKQASVTRIKRGPGIQPLTKGQFQHSLPPLSPISPHHELVLCLNHSLSNREWLTLCLHWKWGLCTQSKIAIEDHKANAPFPGQNAEHRGHWAGKSRHQYLSVLVLHWLLSQHSPKTSDFTIYIYMHIHIYFGVFEAVSCTTGYSWTHYMGEDVLELLISCLWVYRPTSPCLVLSSARNQIQGFMHAT